MAGGSESGPPFCGCWSILSGSNLALDGNLADGLAWNCSLDIAVKIIEYLE
jgi:hypothetical protein